MARVFQQSAECIAKLERVVASSSLKDEVLGLYESFRPRLLRYVVSMGLELSDAEDIVQETFLALHRHLLADRPRTNLSGWIFRVAHRYALKRRIRYRADRYGSVDPTQLQIAVVEPSPEEEFLLNEHQGRLKRIFHALPEMDRLCLQLRAEGLKYREIASVLNISLGSVYNSLERSLSRLRS